VSAAVEESEFVTGFAAQGLEIMGRLPELQPAPDDGGGPRQADDGAEGPSRRAALGGAPQDEESCESGARPDGCIVTDFPAQTVEIMGSLPKLQPAAEDRGKPPETGAEAAASPQASGDDPDPFIPAIYRRHRVRMILNGVMAG
jgi:hypothetical protein